MSKIDTDVSNYTLSELMAIVEVNDLNPVEITNKTNKLINKFKQSNPPLYVFVLGIQSQLLRYAQGLIVDNTKDTSDKIVVENFGNMSNSNSSDASYPDGDQQSNDWYQNENLTQSDPNQTNKITNRQQTTQLFNNQYVPMNREQVSTTDTYQLPVKQDSLNPNLKNIITRFVNLDSQFRQYTSGVDSTSTDYTLDLSDTLKNVLSLRLYSYQIPYNWYTIDSSYGNTCLWISEGDLNIVISIPPGNYTPSQFVTTMNTSFVNAGFSFQASSYISANSPVVYNLNNGIITMYLDNGTFNNGTTSFVITSDTVITFYDFTAVLQCNNNCYSKTNHFFNNSLGWLMGYRNPYEAVDPSGNTAPAILDLNGPKYLILVIDDYNQNHVNNGLVSITQYSSTLKVPSYYSPDLPYTCITPAQQGNNLQQIISGTSDTQSANGLLLAGKYESEYTTTQTVLPSAPRTLTLSQIYTINEINKSRNNTTNYLAKAPTTPDILAIIPIKPSGTSTGSLMVEFSGSLQDNIRTYFGPVNIERMAVKLIDDKGNVINLNGTDWCITLICECLYQY